MFCDEKGTGLPHTALGVKQKEGLQMEGVWVESRLSDSFPPYVNTR